MVLRVLFALTLTALMTGCALLSHNAPPEDVDKAAGLFVQRLNEVEYEKIYNDASKKFKDAKSKTEIIDNLKALSEHGRVLDHRRTSMSFEGEGSGLIAHPTYRSQFEKGGGELLLSFVDEGGEWKLIGFALKLRN